MPSRFPTRRYPVFDILNAEGAGFDTLCSCHTKAAVRDWLTRHQMRIVEVIRDKSGWSVGVVVAPRYARY